MHARLYAKLVNLRRPPSHDCLHVLQELLEQAAAGKLRSLAIVAIQDDQGVHREIAFDGSIGTRTELLGAVELLKQLVLSDIEERIGE
jgi:hypothetical protein